MRRMPMLAGPLVAAFVSPVCAETDPLRKASLFLSAGSSAPVVGASLFASRSAPGLFVPRRLDTVAVPPDDISRLRDLIASAEAGGAGYDAVQYGARVKPGKPPTQMTIAEIEAWIRATPRQPHAIGRYQVIPKTLRRLVREMEIPASAVYDARLQDRMADFLMREAGLDAFLRGELGRRPFMGNLAKVWAGLPLPNGRSYYQGYAGNKATISWTTFDAGMRAIFG